VLLNDRRSFEAARAFGRNESSPMGGLASISRTDFAYRTVLFSFADSDEREVLASLLEGNPKGYDWIRPRAELLRLGRLTDSANDRSIKLASWTAVARVAAEL